MEVDTLVILKLLGDVIDKAGKKWAVNSKGRLPIEIQRKIDSYPMTPWYSGHPDLVALLAMLEVAWAQVIQPLAGKDEIQLQLDSGLNSFVRSTIGPAIDWMKVNRDQIEELRQKCQVILAMANSGLLHVRGALDSGLKFSNLSSQPMFDASTIEMIKKQCRWNIEALDRILSRFQLIIRTNQRDLLSRSMYGPAF